MLAVDDVAYNRFTSTRAVYSVLEKGFGVMESPGIFSKQEIGNPDANCSQQCRDIEKLHVNAANRKDVAGCLTFLFKRLVTGLPSLVK